MNQYFISAILGIVEGLTEFLPVSSTAHLRIAEEMMGISLTDPYWKMFTIVIQLGAILVLPIYFRDRIAKFLSTFPRGERGDRTIFTHPLSLVAVAFVVTAVPSLLLVKTIGKHLESLFIIAVSFIVGGIVMWIVDAINAKWETAGPKTPGNRIHTWHMEDMTLGQAIWIGFCQIFSAVFPGTSRSMSTITGGQIVRMSRPAALEFSFFLSIPIMVAGTGYDLAKSVFGKGENAIGISGVSTHGWMLLLVGLIVSFIVAYGAVAWFMAWVRKHGFVPFAIYRIIAGALLLWFIFSARV